MCLLGSVAALHGDLIPAERQMIMHAYRSGALGILVATDVAARGLDVKAIKSVINFDLPKDIETHIHRVGRTGRAGDRDGIAITLVTPSDERFAPALVRNLQGVGQPVPQALYDLAAKVIV